MTDETTRLRDALLADIHVTYCERSAVAMRNHTPQVTAHQVEGMVADRLTALIEQARQDGAAEARAGMVSVEALAEAIHRGCERRWDEMGRLDPDLAITMHYADAHLRFAAAIVEDLAALAATPPAPAVERCGFPGCLLPKAAHHPCAAESVGGLHVEQLGCHPFAPNPERLLAAIEAQAIGEVEA